MRPAKIYDLSQPVFSDCPQYPDANPRPTSISSLYLQAVHGVNKEIVETSTHTGTHCDAPYHFFEDGETIDRMPLATYVAPAIVLDLRSKKAGEAIERADVEPLPEGFEAGDVVLLNTGNGRLRGNTARFLKQYAWLTGEAAEYLVARGAGGVGIDAVSLGGYGDPKKAGPAHRAMLGNGKCVVEELYFPEGVMDGRKRLFVAAPVKLRGCSGAWTRAMLWEF